MSWKQFLNETMQRISNVRKESPEIFEAYDIMGAAVKKDGALDLKTKEFIALGIAISTKCDSCIGFHTRNLVRAGATRAEMVDAIAMAGYMGAGPNMTYGAKALEAFDEFTS